MTPKKKLILDVADFRKIYAFPEGDTVVLVKPIPFVVYEPQIYSLKTSEDIVEFLTAVLQENHKWSYEPGSKTILIDGIEFEIDGHEIKSSQSELGFYVPTDKMPRNNFNLYKDFLPFLKGEKRILNLLDKVKLALKKVEIFKTHFETINQNFFFEDRDEIQISCVSYSFDRDEKDELPNFVVAVKKDAKELVLKHFLHNEGEWYSNGEDPEKIEEIESEIKRLQKRAALFYELSDKISKITIEHE